MLSRLHAIWVFAMLGEYVEGLVGPGALVYGLRRHAAAGPYRPARTTHTPGHGKPLLRMSGEAEDKDGVMHRVDARLQVEPMSLTVAYFEHAYASPPAEIIADLLEAALSSASYMPPEHLGAVVPVLSSLPSSAPCDYQSPYDSDSHTTRVDQHADEDAADTYARKPDRSATSPNAARLDVTADDSETQQDVASVLERTTRMEQDAGPVTEVKGQIQKWSRYGIVLHFV